MPNKDLIFFGYLFGIVCFIVALMQFLDALQTKRIELFFYSWTAIIVGCLLLIPAICAYMRGRGWNNPPFAGTYKIADPRKGYLPLIRPGDEDSVVFHEFDPKVVTYVDVTANDPKVNTVEVVGDGEFRKVTIYLASQPRIVA